MTSTHLKSAWTPHMPIMYKKKVYTVLCTVHCTLYYTVYSVLTKSCDCHYFHSCDGNGNGGVVVVVMVVVAIVVVVVMLVLGVVKWGRRQNMPAM